MENEILSLKNNKVAEYIIQKSKFISYAYVCKTVKEVDEILQALQNKHSDATHICYAYVLDGQEKCSDNGEPSGTAGKPILEVIKKNNLQNVLIVVVRYFGGVKLGAGGLIRAYSKSAMLTVADNVSKLQKLGKYLVTATLKKYNNVVSTLQKANIKFDNVKFGNAVVFNMYLENDVYLQNLKMLNLIEEFKFEEEVYISW